MFWKDNLRSVCIFVIVLLFLPGVLLGETAECEDLFKNLKATFENIKDYSCIYEAYTSDGKMSEKVVYDYFYKKPRQIRMKVLSGKANYNGTILLYTGGKVRVKVEKGMLSLFTFCLGTDNKRILTLRNYGIDRSDWGWFIDYHIENTPLLDCRSVYEEIVDGRETNVYEIYSKDPVKTDYIAREILWIDKKDNIIVKSSEYDIYNNLLQSFLFKDIVLNSGLEDGLFMNFKIKEQ